MLYIHVYAYLRLNSNISKPFTDTVSLLEVSIISQLVQMKTENAANDY